MTILPSLYLTERKIKSIALAERRHGDEE